MKKVFFNALVCGGLMTMFAACTNDNEPSQVDSRTAAMNIEVYNQAAGSRAQADLIEEANLAADSEIGVYVVKKADAGQYDGGPFANMQYTLTDGKWGTTASPVLTATEAKAVAYYPFKAGNHNYDAIPVTTDEQKDYMYSGFTTAALNNSSPTATFAMNHALAGIRVVVKKDAGYTTAANLTAISATSDAFKASANLNAETGELADKDGAATLSADGLNIALKEAGDNLDFVVIPADDKASITFTMTVSEKAYTAVINPTQALAAGSMHIYTLTLSAEGFKIADTVTVEIWGTGENGSSQIKPAA